MQNNFTQKWVRVMFKPGIFIDLKSTALGPSLIAALTFSIKPLPVFSQVRKWVHDQKGKLLKIRPEDEEYVNRRTAELASKAEMAAKQTYQDSAKEMAKSS